MNDRRVADVSIVCANYNNGKFLTEFIKSVIDSSVEPMELIVIDDGSKDNSLQVLEQYDLSFLKIIKLPHNVGFGNALNEGINVASGKYILRIDPDDLLVKDRISLQYEFLENNPEYGLIGSNAEYFQDNDYQKTNLSNFPTSYKEIKRRYEFGDHGLLHGTVMGKSSLFKNYRYEQSTVPAEDYHIFARMIRDGVLAANLKDVLTKVRIHTNSASNFLPKSTYLKTFNLRDKIFDTNTTWLRLNRTYYCNYYYRKFKYVNSYKRYFFLFLSVILRPDKLWKRLN